MSIFSDLWNKKITWSQAATEIEQWASHWLANDPTAAAVVGELQSDVKQAASDVISAADTWLGQHIGPMTVAIETAADGALAAATGGVSVPFNGLVNDGIDRIVNFGKQRLDAWALEQKAKLSAPSK